MPRRPLKSLGLGEVLTNTQVIRRWAMEDIPYVDLLGGVYGAMSIAVGTDVHLVQHGGVIAHRPLGKRFGLGLWHVFHPHKGYRRAVGPSFELYIVPNLNVHGAVRVWAEEIAGLVRRWAGNTPLQQQQIVDQLRRREWTLKRFCEQWEVPVPDSVLVADTYNRGSMVARHAALRLSPG